MTSPSESARPATQVRPATAPLRPSAEPRPATPALRPPPAPADSPPPTAAPPASRLLQWASRQSQTDRPAGPTARRLAGPTPSQATPAAKPFVDSEPAPDAFKTPSDARAFLERLREKTNQVIQDFAQGTINQRQFQVIYSHYQRQRQAVEKALIEMPGSGAWRQVAVEGKTTMLRQQYAARLISYAIYETASGMPLAQRGDFQLDPALVVPMLSSFRSITQEIFGGGMRRTEIEGGRWLCFVPGQQTTLIAIYQEEPATLQLSSLEDLHRDFEFIYETAQERGEDISQLGQVFTHLWAPGADKV